MTHRTIQAVLRTFTDAGPPVSDADLLRRFVADRDEAAFALLVRRHGRLVWAVCRHLTRSDAEADDAFQATFLVLIRNAAKVRDAGKLSSWLHGVAYRVCTKARQSTKRRTDREAITARPERNGRPVPDSAWDRALAAVHEELAKLPDTLRVPFVLCCLEGKGQTEAADQLGWKLGTLSGRLTRAKDAVLAKLDARGLTLGAVAAVGLVAPPPGVAAKAAELVRAGFAVPGSILQLSQGVIGMSVNQVKLLAAGLLLACGLGVSGTAWMNSADAQSFPAKESAEQRVKRLEKELEEAKAETTRVGKVRGLLEVHVVKSPNPFVGKWEYRYVPKEVGYAPTAGDFTAMLRTLDGDGGWEFVGQITTGGNPGQKPELPTLVFRRPKAVTPPSTALARPVEVKPLGDPLRFTDSRPIEKADPKPLTPTLKTAKWFDSPTKPASIAADDVAAIEAEIKKLQDRLAAIRKKEPSDTSKLTLRGDELPIPAANLSDLLRTLAEKKFGKGGWSIDKVDETVVVEGDGKVRSWAWEVTKKLNEK